MATKRQVLDLALRGMSYEEIGLALGLSPGLAYLIATGVPVDGSDALSPEDRRRPGLLRGSTQHLASPPAAAPKASETVHRWMEQMAGGDAQMGSAAGDRRVAVVTARPGHRRLESDDRPVAAHEGGTGPHDQSEAGGESAPPDVLSVLGREHNDIHAILHELSSLRGMRDGGSPDELSRRESLADVAIERLSAHEAAEERLFWPAVADTVDGGPSIAAMAREQEKEAKRVLGELRGLGKDNERFDDLVDELAELVRKHVAFEDAVFARVEEQLTAERRCELGGRLADVLAHSPTRPHPHAPHDAAVLHVMGPAVAAVDRLRDRHSDRPADREGRATNPSTAERRPT